MIPAYTCVEIPIVFTNVVAWPNRSCRIPKRQIALTAWFKGNELYPFDMHRVALGAVADFGCCTEGTFGQRVTKAGALDDLLNHLQRGFGIAEAEARTF